MAASDFDSAFDSLLNELSQITDRFLLCDRLLSVKFPPGVELALLQAMRNVLTNFAPQASPADKRSTCLASMGLTTIPKSLLCEVFQHIPLQQSIQMARISKTFKGL